MFHIAGIVLPAGFFSVHLRDHSIGRMMLFLIVGLCQDPDFEVHVFGSGDKKKQNNATAGSEIGGDAVVGTLQAAVQHWHKVKESVKFDLLSSLLTK